MQSSDDVLVGDIGGTHSRFAIATLGALARPALHHRGDIQGEYKDAASLLRAYQRCAGLDRLPPHAIIAVAGPVEAGKVTLTNRRLTLSALELRAYGFEQAALINDFGALAYAADLLGGSDLQDVGPALEGCRDAPISIVGAGTGFGVSCLVRDRGRAFPLVTEGGHIGFAPTDNQQMALLCGLQNYFGRVSVERVLSGAGLEAIHRTLQSMEGATGASLSAEQITACATAGDTACGATVSLFCKLYGAIAGDIVLAHGARGGVLIGGGIAPKIAPALLASHFRQEFENKGRLASYMKSIPSRLILNEDAPLLGAARAAHEILRRA